jgi:alpha-glucosidase (family GH31 glycosyl hydrolase)
MWDEYLYGPSLLVAPVWKTGQREREVYLPKGKWQDLWDPNKKYEGPTTIKVSVPLDKIAVFIRLEKADLLPKGLIEGL